MIDCFNEHDAPKGTYRQCILTRPTDKGEMRLVTWISSKHAKEGKAVVVIGSEYGAWTVSKVFSQVITGQELSEYRSRQHLYARLVK